MTYDSPRGGIRVTTRKDEASTSYLLIENAQPSDSGVYQCNPSNAKSKSVTVHVLNGNVIEFIYNLLHFNHFQLSTYMYIGRNANFLNVTDRQI